MRNLTLENWLRIALSLMIVLATMLVGIGERMWLMTWIAIGVLLVSAYVTDFKNLFRLKQPVADCLALLVVAISVVTALRLDRQSQLVGLVNLQSYLQFVLLFQPKTPRVYWQLGLLSLGQLAIGSTLVPGLTFGIVIVFYLIAGVIGFALLLLHSEQMAIGKASKASGGGEPDALPTTSRAQRAPLLVGNHVPVEPWRLLPGLASQAIPVGAVTLLVAALIFYSMPRWHVPNQEIATNEPLRTVGFSKTVTLGELGEVINNSDLVMRIQFLRDFSNQPFKLANEPLLRGTAVSRYRNGSWTHDLPGSLGPLSTQGADHFVRQRITLEPLDVNEVFCIYPIFAIRPDTKLRVNAASDQLFRQEDDRFRQIEFEVGTLGIQGDRQLSIVPRENAMHDQWLRRLLSMPDGGQLAGLQAQAEAVLADKGIDPQTDRLAAARALNDFFANGTFLYNLEGQERPAGVDPLEDFVVRHRQGHCEYFAGALAMMLRSVGIPSRVVLGFKGGEWNPVGMYYQVQQLHAHAWVEAYLEADQIPPDAFSVDDMPAAAWAVLDPTSGAQEGPHATATANLLARISQYMDYAQVLWSNYVVGFNSKRQRQGIYEPISQVVDETVDSITNPEVWRARGRAIAASHLGTFWDWYRRHWFSWRGGLVAAGFSALVASGYLIARAVLRVVRRGRSGRKRAAEEGAVLEIYRRLEAALSQRGLRREPSQTAYEFAAFAGGTLAETQELRRLAPLPRRVVDAFYRVRFGGHTLDNSEAEAVEHALAELELAFSRPR